MLLFPRQIKPRRSALLKYVSRIHLRVGFTHLGKKFVGVVHVGGCGELWFELLSLFLFLLAVALIFRGLFLEELRVAWIGALALVGEREEALLLALFNLLCVAYLVRG